jgi:uncharacterized protein (TIGR00288 family)
MSERKKIALLIDYDNFNKFDYFKILFEELNEIGDVIIKHAYYSNLTDGTIKEKFIKLGIEPISQIAYSTGKNAVDIRIALEAMELLNRNYIDCFCLATNDSDFTPLVMHLQKNNKYIIGAGDDKASDSFIKACNYFISVSKILQSKTKPVPKPNGAPALPLTAKTTDKKKIVPVTPQKDEEMEKLVKVISNIIDSNHEDDGFSDFSWVMLTLNNEIRDFNPKNYGCNNKNALPFFKNYLAKYFELKTDNNYQYYIRKVVNG